MILSKKQMTEEDIKLQYITPAIVSKWDQSKTTVPVLEEDTPEVLAARVLEREHEFLVEVIADIVNGKITLG